MDKPKYKVVTVGTPKDLERALNDYSEQGWYPLIVTEQPVADYTVVFYRWRPSGEEKAE